jgi:hypothetical protein
MILLCATRQILEQSHIASIFRALLNNPYKRGIISSGDNVRIWKELVVSDYSV